VAHGCTRRQEQRPWQQPIAGLNGIDLVDTPGIEEIAAAARERLALAWLAAGQTNAAETLLRAGLQSNPGEIRFARVLGHSVLSRGLAQDALTLLRPLAPPMAKDPDYHALLAAAEQGTGAHALAATRYRGLLQVQAANGQWLVGLGISLAALGDSRAAAAAFNPALADCPMTSSKEAAATLAIVATSSRSASRPLIAYPLPTVG
jgi:Tfp pilus assembly protein PilF